MGIYKRVDQIIEASFTGQMYKDVDALFKKMEKDAEGIVKQLSTKFGIKWKNKIDALEEKYGREVFVEIANLLRGHQLLDTLTKDWLLKKRRK